MTLATITAYLIPALGTGLAVTVLAWILGKFTGAAWYQTLRAKAGRQAYRAGEFVSLLGNTRLGAALSEPIEDVAADWGQFMPEQFFAGLRADNRKKLEKQLDRLEDVGSVSRAKAIAEKIEAIEAAPPVMQTEQDAAMFLKAFEAGDRSINERLGG